MTAKGRRTTNPERTHCCFAREPKISNTVFSFGPELGAEMPDGGTFMRVLIWMTPEKVMGQKRWKDV